MSLTSQPAWRALEAHAEALRLRHLRQLFAEDSQRFTRFSINSDGLLLDFSKQRITAQTLTLLHAYAEAAQLGSWRERFQRGEIVNCTEQRAARHPALRAGAEAPLEVRNELQRLHAFCEAVHGGHWRGFSGERITDVVNLGIGGSDLGPRMAVKALAAWHQPDIRVHFVSNVDGADLATTLAGLNPRSTLFIVASKSFSTQETLLNARSARQWLLATAGDESAVGRHFVALSTQLDATRQFGIAPENVFAFWDWVGGRFSWSSAIGLSIALAVGWRHFEQLLAGAQRMDQHFFSTPAEQNLPLTLALLSLWNSSFLGAQTHAIFPYSQSLALFPAYLQQLEMESNGKGIGRDGLPVEAATSPIIWGEAGTNGQHSFYQLLHQSGQLVAADFIALQTADFALPGHHPILLAHCLAQSACLAFGQTEEEARAGGSPENLLSHKRMPGNQPSSTLVLPALTPHTLGQLLALYEHKVFCLGVLWGINSFDQWGVELGKRIANKLLPALQGGKLPDGLDASTTGLLHALGGRK